MHSNRIQWALPIPIVPLNGPALCLEPLKPSHEADLIEIAAHPEVWRYLSSYAESSEEMHNYVLEALKDFRMGTAIPFVVRAASDGSVLVMTRLKDLSSQNKKATVGSWLTPSSWGSGANTESKFLLLQFAFDVLACYRIEFITDARNLRSRSALTKLGAVEEGKLRSHLITRDGHRRDSVVFSVLDTEWPFVKHRLVRLLNTKLIAPDQ
jgi:RimJ/RimL family protein N-acetyltransferase